MRKSYDDKSLYEMAHDFVLSEKPFLSGVDFIRAVEDAYVDMKSSYDSYMYDNLRDDRW